jgi:CRISPR-associated protein Cst2
MSTFYLYGTVLTGVSVAANNRGDNIGNTTTLQKVFLRDQLHTSVSAEAIRFAIRYRFQLEGLPVNRQFDGERLVYEDEKRAYWKGEGTPYIDDDLMGFMDAAAAKQEQEEETESEESTGKQPAKKAKGKTTRRQSPLAIARAVSLRPYRGELSFNAVSGEKEKGKLSLYSAEMHTTEYQYSFGLNLGDVLSKANIRHLIDAIVDLPQVAGNHARFAYDFSPASLVLRLTSSHSPRIQQIFEYDEATASYRLDKLIQQARSGDIPASEIMIGGEAANTEAGKQLLALGAFVSPGVRETAAEAKKRIAELGGDYSLVRE